jgi:hypothetical protein
VLYLGITTSRAGVVFSGEFKKIKMETEYYCKECGVYFIEESLPNINKIHKRCGKAARIVSHRKKEEAEINSLK